MLRAILALLALAGQAWPEPFRLESLEASVKPILGRPYVWGASGLKSYDCSGFVWRSLRDAGVFLKRTTARKMYFSLPPAAGPDLSRAGTLVFFSDLAHVGLLHGEQEFFHASSTRGTVRESLNSYWRQRVTGYRRVGGK